MTHVHVAVVKNISNVAVNSSIYKGLRGFYKIWNMHNFAFRYKLDTNCKFVKILWKAYIKRDKRDFGILIYPFLYDINNKNIIIISEMVIWINSY